MEGPRGLLYQFRPSHGAQNRLDYPDHSWIHRTSFSSAHVTHGPPLGDTALRTLDNWMLPRYTRENPMDNSVHDLDACAVLSQDRGTTQKEYCYSHSANPMGRLPSHNQIWSLTGVNESIHGNHALAPSIDPGEAYQELPQNPCSPYSAVSTSMVRLNPVVGQPPLALLLNVPIGGNLTSETSSTCSQDYSSLQSRSGRDPMHG